MNTFLASLAAGLWPLFALSPGSEPAPVLWETPVSQAAPAIAANILKLAPSVQATLEEASQTRLTAGPDAALAGLEKAVDPALVLFRAGLKRATGNWAEAQADYEKVLSSPDRSTLRSLALAGFKTVLRQRLADGDKLSYQPLLRILKEEWFNEEALELVEAIYADPEAPAEVLDYARSEEPLLALRLGRYEQAARLWAASGTVKEMRWLAETELRRGNFDRAAELRLGAASGRPEGPRLASDPQMAFNILAKGGLYRKALDLAEKHPVLKKGPDYGWRLGLAALAEKDWEAARAHLEPLTKGGKRQEGAWYFLGRVLDGADRSVEARAAYARAAKGPAGYYRILAEGRLENTWPAPDPLWGPLMALGPEGHDHGSLGFHLWITEKAFSGPGLEQAAADLLAAGPVLAGGQAADMLNETLAEHLAQRNWAELINICQSQPESFKNLSPAARGLWPLLVASASARSGDYRWALKVLATIKGDGQPGLKKWGHPVVYSRQVSEAWRRHGLSPALLLALIRTESAYQADVISTANARGLMQLLPATAAKVARALNEEDPGPLGLFQPDLNVRYGSWYLAALIEGFGHEALALAGYNGGPYNVKSLILAKPEMPLDVFIESLNAEETVNYVKRVIESRYIYEMAYLGRAVRPDLTGPLPSPRPGLPDF